MQDRSRRDLLKAFGAGAATLTVGPLLTACGQSRMARHYPQEPYYTGYFFKGSDYLRWDLATHSVDRGYPKKIGPNWRGIWPEGFNAVVLWVGGRAYFFKDQEYIRYNLAAAAAVPGYPKPIAGNWPGIFPSGLNGASMWTDGRAFFFRGSEYVGFNVQTETSFGAAPIRSGWPGVFPDGIDAPVLWPDGTA